MLVVVNMIIMDDNGDNDHTLDTDTDNDDDDDACDDDNEATTHLSWSISRMMCMGVSVASRYSWTSSGGLDSWVKSSWPLAGSRLLKCSRLSLKLLRSPSAGKADRLGNWEGKGGGGYFRCICLLLIRTMFWWLRC